MGAGTSLYSATCFALGKYGNGNPYPINLSTVIGLSGWLPCAKYVFLFSLLSPRLIGIFESICFIFYPHRTLVGKLEEEQIKNRAASLPILVCHGKGN